MIKTRKAVPEDARHLPDVERSAGRAFLTIPDLAWIADDDVQSVERHLDLIAGGYAWTALEDGATVGFLSAEKTDNALHIWELAVHSDLQRRGIGGALIRHVIDAAKAERLEAVTLTTFRDVPWNEPFYRNVGFRSLPANSMPKRMRAILADEVAHGLPPQKRCGMIFNIR